MITLKKVTWISNPDGYFLDRPKGKPVRGIAINGRHPGSFDSNEATPAEWALSGLDKDALGQVYLAVQMGGRAKELREAQFGDSLSVEERQKT